MKVKTVLLILLTIGAAIRVDAQQGRARRDILQRQESSVGGRDVVTAMHVYRGAVVEPAHTHPGDLVGYVVEGTVSLTVDGKAAVTLRAGETFFVAGGTVHHVATSSDARILATYIVEKDKPLAAAAQ